MRTMSLSKLHRGGTKQPLTQENIYWLVDQRWFNVSTLSPGAATPHNQISVACYTHRAVKEVLMSRPLVCEHTPNSESFEDSFRGMLWQVLVLLRQDMLQSVVLYYTPCTPSGGVLDVRPEQFTSCPVSVCASKAPPEVGE